MMDTPTLRAHWKQHTPRPVWWYDWRSGALYAPDGTRTGTKLNAAQLLELLKGSFPRRDQVLYILAGETNDTAPPHAWYRFPVADGWQVRYRREQPPLRSATYTRAGHQGEITFRHTSAWFRHETSLERICEAYTRLQRLLIAAWADPHVVLLSTPAQTGLDLLARALPCDKQGKGYAYPIIEPELWQSMHDYGYQHRLEMCTLPEIEAAPGYWYLDGRFAYAAHTRNVPCWLEKHDHINLYEPHRPAWYHVTATVPQGWGHVGILKAPGELRWPSEPGATIDTWTDEHEVALAVGHGWEVKIHERYMFNVSQPGSDPLNTWTKRLVRLYLDAIKQGEPLLKEALGHLLYDTLGTFKRSESSETVWIPDGGELPPDAEDVQAVSGGYEAKVKTPLSAYQLQWAQVQWWVSVVHKQRSSLMWKVLATPRPHLAAIRTDAAHLLGKPDPLIWLDIGRVGDYRLKGQYDMPLHGVPRTEEQLFACIQASELVARGDALLKKVPGQLT